MSPRALALSLAVLAGCAAEPPRPSGTAEAVEQRTASPQAVRYRPSIELTGSLEPIASVQLGFDVGGRLEALLVQRGDRVRAGQALARLDDSIAAAQLAQAAAALAGAQAQAAGGEASFERAQKLKAAGAFTDQAYSDAEAGIKVVRAGIEQATAAVRMAQANLDKHTLRAPIGGVVTSGPDNVGALLGPGVPLFVIEDLSALQIRATAPESTGWLREGQDALIVAGAPGAAGGFAGKVVRVLPSLDPATRRVPVEIRIDAPDPSLRAHGFARVTVSASEELDVWSVPRAAIVARPDFCVYVAGAPDGPRRVPVDILDEGGGGDSVVAGALSAQDALILDPPITLGAE